MHAASVIGARFEAELLAALGIDAVVDEPRPSNCVRAPGGCPNRWCRSSQSAIHAPWVNFTNVPPTVAFVIPNLDDDMSSE